jgi:squalene-hopene/tetraprenyl-beta-curcumene cyclase
MHLRSWLVFGAMAMVALTAALPVPACRADDAATKKMAEMIDKAVAFLGTKAQATDGSFNKEAGPAVTALVATGILKHGRSPEDPVVAKAIKYVEGFIKEDGGIYGTTNKNYETAIAIVMFKEANRNGKYDAVLKKADAFIKGFQWGADGKTTADSVQFGGAGYGRTGDRPDLSNTSFMVDALKAGGNDANSEAIQRALIFVSRCQNLEGPNNTTPFAAKLNDGGFYYTPAAGGVSQAGTDEATGGLRSYASMTYAGLKSMIYAGVKADDPRVKAALGWLKKHYDLDSNPGMGTAGLFYYYQTFAKALAALGEDKFVDEQGVTHDWRADLIEAIAKRQKADGSWTNENAKWMEGDASLCTAYSLMALAYAKK